MKYHLTAEIYVSSVINLVILNQKGKKTPNYYAKIVVNTEIWIKLKVRFEKQAGIRIKHRGF